MPNRVAVSRMTDVSAPIPHWTVHLNSPSAQSGRAVKTTGARAGSRTLNLGLRDSRQIVSGRLNEDQGVSRVFECYDAIVSRRLRECQGVSRLSCQCGGNLAREESQVSKSRSRIELVKQLGDSGSALLETAGLRGRTWKPGSADYIK